MEVAKTNDKVVNSHSRTQLNSGFLNKPVIMVKAEDAEHLMGLVNKNEEAMVEISIMMETTKWVSRHENTHRRRHTPRMGTDMLILRHLLSLPL